MAKPEQTEAYDKALSSNLARTLDLLKFAEAKNAALLAFASAWIVGLVNLLSSGKILPFGYTTACVTALPLFVVAAVLAIISLLPKLSTSTFTHEPKGQSRNLLFFGDIAAMTVEEFKLEIRKAHWPAPGEAASATYLDNMEGQIAINSKIAKRKYRLFNWGASTALLAVSTFAIPTAWLTGCAILTWICLQ